MSDSPHPGKKRRLLVVDDDASNRDIVARTFKDDFEIFQAADGETGLEEARKIKPHVIITDQRMPRLSGVDMLRQIKEELPGTLRVLFTGYADYGTLVDAVNAAAVHHYLEKPFHTVDVKTVVDTLVRTQELELERGQLIERLQANVDNLQAANKRLSEQEANLQSMVASRTQELAAINTQLADANQHLQKMATSDSLTGAFNRRYANDYLDIELARSHRYGRTFGVLFLDLDDFKLVNDEHGHQVGDQVLVRLAERLDPGRNGMRKSDLLARFGGEEFLMLLPETDREGAAIKAERVRKGVEELDWSELLGPDHKSVTVSIGVAVFPDDGETVDEIIKAADTALYASKRAGKNRVTLAG